jgi:hypothetical protein
MTLEKLIMLCQAYSNLGDAVGKQLCDVVFGGEYVADKNPNAIKLIDRNFIAAVERAGVDVSDWRDAVAVAEKAADRA